MTIAGFFKRYFGQMAEVPAMARAETVASLVPADAQYVTVGPVAVLPDVWVFNGGKPGTRYGLGLGYLPARYQQEIAYLVRTADRLAVVARSGPRWSCPLTDLTDLDGHRENGFLVFTKNREGLAVGSQTPVIVPPGASFRTLAPYKWTNLFLGWDEELMPFGVRRHF
ncbi:hypothetical protein [Couchioplanes azureus]|uniref:hypothetical protein n=1 Tax=Couchioplanes caeruleus TaxID=56438 RepID=UPI00167173F4|nr:hypothetical protein [Couchioplanes caeruleus]GGQ50582.1 hypothetical protein GCM10010166_18970 [Couchioplanes caeruleus subsp. azureus]